MKLPKTYVFWYARRIIDSLYEKNIKPMLCWLVWAGIYVFTATILLFVTAYFCIQREAKREYDFSTELFDVRSATVGNYTSGDSATDRVVNYFAGKEDLPLDLKAEILLCHEIDICNILVRGHQDSFARAAEFLLSIYDTISIERYIMLMNLIEKPVESHFTWIPDSVDRDALYYAVWKTYFESGAPLLEIRPDPHSVPSYYFGACMYYDPFQHKLYLQDPFLTSSTSFQWGLDDFLEELGHAKQFEERPWTSCVGSLLGLARTLGRATVCELKDKNSCSLSKAYDHEYTYEGSFEYEAHSVLGAMLKKRCRDAMDMSACDIAY